jgi:ABC-type Fe3+-hydroxamate transport system substrate-binding protein
LVVFTSRTALLAAGLLAACGGTEQSSSVLDDAGQPVLLESAAQRIVSLSPSTTELLFALGAGRRLVGRTRWCADPVEATAVPSVGDGLDPNIELIVARRPDLVVFYHSAQNASAIAQLHGLGIATASVKLDRLGDLARAARMLGRLTGSTARADSLNRVLEAQIRTQEPRRSPEPPNVLLLAWDTPPIVIGGGSFLSELVRLAGGVNVFEDLPQPSVPVSIEAVAAREVDVVLVVGEQEPAFLGRPEWQAVDAVRHRRYARVQGTEFAWPSFRAPMAIARLRSVLAASR